MADKKEFHFFVLPEYEEEEKYLCDMAKKGYLFEKQMMIFLMTMNQELKCWKE